MARLMLFGGYDLFHEYQPIGLEETVEKRLKELGAPLGPGRINRGEVYTSDSTVLSLSYSRYSTLKYRDLTISYHKAIALHQEKELSFDGFMARLQDESQVYQSLFFTADDGSALTIGDDVQRVPEVFGETDVPLLKTVKNKLEQKYSNVNATLQELFYGALDAVERSK